MDRIRILIAMLLSTLVLVGYPFLINRLYPPPPQQLDESQPEGQTQPAPDTPAPVVKKPATQPPAATPTVTQETEREITVETPYWRIKLSNRGAVATSWILKKERANSVERDIRAADGSPLELVPRDALDLLGAPLHIRTPLREELAQQINKSNFRIEGVSNQEISLSSDETREIVFTYASGSVTARKTLKFYADRFYFDAQVQVFSDGSEQMVELVIGPRIGDQTEQQNGSYSVPPQVVAETKQDSRIYVPGASITPPFAKITSIVENRIQIDKPLASDIDQIKIVGGDGATLLGFARVVDREQGSLALTVDQLPQGASVGSGVAQGLDILRQGYRWAGLVDRYFAMVAVPARQFDELRLTSIKIKNPNEESPRDYPSVAVSAESKLRIFVGPKDRELLAQVSQEMGANLENLIDYGFFASIIRPIIPAISWALGGLSAFFHNYGWAIVVVTLVINLALSPLRWYSSKKMKQTAKHQPRLKELQERLKKLKENPKKNEREMMEVQREQMALMKEANPLGGCLPMLLQMPVFWAFFIYLTVSLEVRQQPWILWIRDLSTSDPYHILPVVMCATMIASTWFTPQPNVDDPQMKMQRMMMTWVMPIMLTWLFFWSAPSGLVLYWMVGNVVGVLIQLVINRLTAEPPAATPGSPTKAVKKSKERRAVQQV